MTRLVRSGRVIGVQQFVDGVELVVGDGQVDHIAILEHEVRSGDDAGAQPPHRDHSNLAGAFDLGDGAAGERRQGPFDR